MCGGKRPAGVGDRGYYLEPTVFKCTGTERLWHQEVFGPVLAVCTFSTEAQAVHLANQSSFGLAAAVISNDLTRCDRVARALQAGIVWVNCSQPCFCQAPWGGCKRSGNGSRDLGQAGLAGYLETKQVTQYVPTAQPWGWYRDMPNSFMAKL
eukprot:TRINITY_DN45347_c0_g1_i1.p2 TRINITY_DN45347_c0_g1~~TRINITY_DN45347_c0_g1_i1.p2  ORF type:complete len:152 (+),score=42.28 TRINITY_DN45347_c0_g1_i1:183-638(+)